MLDALFWCHRGWTEEMLSAGVSGRGAGYPCYIYTCQQKPAQCPLAAIVSNCPLARQQTHNMLKIEYFLCLLTTTFSAERVRTPHILFGCVVNLWLNNYPTRTLLYGKIYEA